MWLFTPNISFYGEVPFLYAIATRPRTHIKAPLRNHNEALFLSDVFYNLRLWGRRFVVDQAIP